jgi:hypothetical protein
MTNAGATWMRWLENATKVLEKIKESLEKEGKKEDEWKDCLALLRTTRKLSSVTNWDFSERTNPGPFLKILLRYLEKLSDASQGFVGLIAYLYALIAEVTGEIPENL